MEERQKKEMGENYEENESKIILLCTILDIFIFSPLSLSKLNYEKEIFKFSLFSFLFHNSKQIIKVSYCQYAQIHINVVSSVLPLHHSYQLYLSIYLKTVKTSTNTSRN